MLFQQTAPARHFVHNAVFSERMPVDGSIDRDNRFSALGLHSRRECGERQVRAHLYDRIHVVGECSVCKMDVTVREDGHASTRSATRAD